MALRSFLSSDSWTSRSAWKSGSASMALILS